MIFCKMYVAFGCGGHTFFKVQKMHIYLIDIGISVVWNVKINEYKKDS